MNIEKIYIVHAETLQRLIYGIRVLIFAWPELGREENILPLYAAVLDSAAYSPLVDVGICCIYKGISHLQRQISGQHHHQHDGQAGRLFSSGSNAAVR